MMSSYSIKPMNNVLRTEMEAGPARTRRRYISVPVEVKASWRLTLSQLQTFQAFFKNDIFDGAAWFNIKVVDGRGEATYKARFKEPYEASTEAREHLWSVSATLEVMM